MSKNKITRGKSGTSLDSSLENRLKGYALAATAAGVSVVAFAQASDAEIIYTNVNKPVILNGAPLSLDVNNDGVVDFTLTNFSSLTGGLGFFFLAIAPAQSSNEILQVTSHKKAVAAALSAGHQIGAKSSFRKNPPRLYMARDKFNTSTGSSYGPWLSVEYAYLGLKFVINGQTHYGWAQVKFSQTGGFRSATLSGYAYESIADQPIAAGKKTGTDNEVNNGSPIATDVGHRVPTLGVLAAGACCLLHWRTGAEQHATLARELAQSKEPERGDR
jgi:hypothetical protein